MNDAELGARLQQAAADPDHVVFHSYRIVEELEDANLSSVHTILRFMENNPELDYGAPGPLVHFAEDFFGRGYEAELFASLARRPTCQTVTMLVRIINGAVNVGERARLILLLEQAGDHPLADEDTKQQVQWHLQRFLGRE